jgi:hypothetical protein
MTAIQDFSIPLGDDLDVVFSLDPADNISLTGATVNWQVYAMNFAVPDTTQQLLAKNSGSGGVTIDDTAGQFIVHLVAADTEPMFCGNYYHEAEIVDASGNHATVCQGAMAVTQAMIP